MENGPFAIEASRARPAGMEWLPFKDDPTEARGGLATGFDVGLSASHVQAYRWGNGMKSSHAYD